jgi:hypothetical protein
VFVLSQQKARWLRVRILWSAARSSLRRQGGNQRKRSAAANADAWTGPEGQRMKRKPKRIPVHGRITAVSVGDKTWPIDGVTFRKGDQIKITIEHLTRGSVVPRFVVQWCET